LLHAGGKGPKVKALARRCQDLFPHGDPRVSRELAVLLTYFDTTGLCEEPVQARLLDALLASKGDRQQQLHYFYCLRLLKRNWTAVQKDLLLDWYDSTRAWEGGMSFKAFQQSILRDYQPIFTAEDRLRTIARAEQVPWAAAAMLRLAPPGEVPDPTVLAGVL